MQIDSKVVKTLREKTSAGMMDCVGCGRCAAVCHGDVGMPSVVEIIRRATAEIDKHELVTH